MGDNTGAHFRNVEAQMNNFMRPSPAPAHYAPAARAMSHSGGARGSPVGEFTHRFVRNLLR